jgi:hypothetical protein
MNYYKFSVPIYLVCVFLSYFQAVLPGHDVLLGNLNLDVNQVLYTFRELLLQVAYNLMMVQADSSPHGDMQEVRQRRIIEINVIYY